MPVIVVVTAVACLLIRYLVYVQHRDILHGGNNPIHSLFPGRCISELSDFTSTNPPRDPELQEQIERLLAI